MTDDSAKVSGRKRPGISQTTFDFIQPETSLPQGVVAIDWVLTDCLPSLGLALTGWMMLPRLKLPSLGLAMKLALKVPSLGLAMKLALIDWMMPSQLPSLGLAMSDWRMPSHAKLKLP